MIVPFSTSQSAASTFQRCAAAAISISRAVAPAWRRYSCELRIDWLPPVAIEPHTRLRLRLSALDTNSVRTLRQLHSSSSATSIGSPVELPCPISERATRMRTSSLGRITIQAVSSGPAGVAARGRAAVSLAGTCASAGNVTSSARPPPTAVDTLRKSRRDLRKGIGISKAMWHYRTIANSDRRKSRQFCALSGPPASQDPSLSTSAEDLRAKLQRLAGFLKRDPANPSLASDVAQLHTRLGEFAE